MHVVGLVGFWLVLILGVVIIPFGVAGTFIIAGGVLVHGLLTRFQIFPLSFVVLLFGLAILVELIEALLGAVLARRFGGSRWGMTGAILGGFAGAMIGTPVTPVVGTLLGGFIGACIGATFLEYLHKPDFHSAMRVGFGAFLGALGGKVTKVVVAIVMVILVAVRMF
jgi:uncharacterized protein YqgC (DUF456 family)